MASAESKDAASRPGGPGGTRGMLSLDDLRKAGEEGTIDTVVTAFTDMQGRLFGKRIEIDYFLEEVTSHGIEGCNYLLALDMEMEPVPGYEMANWEKGYGDFGIQPDMATLRQIPWLDRTAMVVADVVNHDGSPVAASPRQILIAQYERAAEMGYSPYFASELEFYLYKESYAEAWEKGYRDLAPTIPYILDYHVLATTMDEQYVGAIRRGMHAAGIPVEFSKGEAWRGQHEVNTRYADAVAPAVNSYKRYATESWAPTSISWGRDNRTCGFRIVGHGQSRRVECRIPGADVNPYLGIAALLAAGLDGIENETDPGPELKGNAYEAAEAEPFPSSLREAVDLWEGSEFAKGAFGESVWKHYLNYGRTEQRLFDQVVTGYE